MMLNIALFVPFAALYRYQINVGPSEQTYIILEQGENKNTTFSIGKVKYVRETNTKIN